MYKKILITAFSSICLLGVANASYLTPETNLATLKSEIVKYHQSGAYVHEIKKIELRAKAFLRKKVVQNKKLKEPQKLAMVLDIDETSLSNYKNSKQISFGGNGRIYTENQMKADAPAIHPTLDLYRYAVKHDVTVFFITGRSEQVRAATVKNLEAAGYKAGDKASTVACEKTAVNDNCLLYLRYGPYLHTSAIRYKSEMRKKIQKTGYKIVVNIGDQYSDLAGGYSLRSYKYPNFMYYVG